MTQDRGFAGLPESLQPSNLPARLVVPRASTAVDLEQVLLDAIQIRSACGFMWMRMAVAKDAQDAYDVAHREFADHEAAFRRLETSLPAALAHLDPLRDGRFTENEIKDVVTALYQDGHVDLVLADRVATLMSAACSRPNPRIMGLISAASHASAYLRESEDPSSTDMGDRLWDAIEAVTQADAAAEQAHP